jgi:hypothetical protein
MATLTKRAEDIVDWTVRRVSAFGGKADIGLTSLHVRF